MLGEGLDQVSPQEMTLSHGTPASPSGPPTPMDFLAMIMACMAQQTKAINDSLKPITERLDRLKGAHHGHIDTHAIANYDFQDGDFPPTQPFPDDFKYGIPEHNVRLQQQADEEAKLQRNAEQAHTTELTRQVEPHTYYDPSQWDKYNADLEDIDMFSEADIIQSGDHADTPIPICSASTAPDNFARLPKPGTTTYTQKASKVKCPNATNQPQTAPFSGLAALTQNQLNDRRTTKAMLYANASALGLFLPTNTKKADIVKAYQTAVATSNIPGALQIPQPPALAPTAPKAPA